MGGIPSLPCLPTTHPLGLHHRHMCPHPFTPTPHLLQVLVRGVGSWGRPRRVRRGVLLLVLVQVGVCRLLRPQLRDPAREEGVHASMGMCACVRGCMHLHVRKRVGGAQACLLAPADALARASALRLSQNGLTLKK